MEANRLGLPTFGGDLNPVATLITKALVEIPAKFSEQPPISNTPGLIQYEEEKKIWKRAQGLADDIRFYGEWIRNRAQEEIGHLYPKVQLPDKSGGGEATVVAWLWARTVKSPDPAWDGYIPLIKSGILRKGKGKSTIWIEPQINSVKQTITYKIKDEGIPNKGTLKRCIATGVPIEFKYLRQQGKRNSIKKTLIAVATVEDKRKQGGRIYIDHMDLPDVPDPIWKPDLPLPVKALGFRIQGYGMKVWSDLFTNRQLVALSTFSKLLSEVRPVIEKHAYRAGLKQDNIPLRNGGAGVRAYADALITYLSFALDKLASSNNSLSVWKPDAECPVSPFSRSDLPMVWDFAEANPLSSSSGSWKVMVDGILRAFRSKAWPLHSSHKSIHIQQRDAADYLKMFRQVIVCTDPPYYDNVPYADLSDFFYVWLRHNLSQIWPDECATLATPKRAELIASPERAGSHKAARIHFESGMANVLTKIRKVQHKDYPAVIFYAFKQQEIRNNGKTSTGWETFLQGLVDAGLYITATWPIRTEYTNRLRAQRSAALASSVILACRPRSDQAPTETRGGLISALRAELPEAIRMLQQQNIAPVDMAQSAIGPGMKVFSRYCKVMEADGSVMSVHTALGLINDTLGEVLSEEEAELDAESRFALTWYDQYGYAWGPFGDADVLARAKVTAVEGVVDAGIAISQSGKVRLLRREELKTDWSPGEDKRPTTWESVQHLIRHLQRSEVEVAALLRQLGRIADQARQLAYLLYAVCEEKKWSEEAVAYNGLIAAWPELSRMASVDSGEQQTILQEEDPYGHR